MEFGFLSTPDLILLLLTSTPKQVYWAWETHVETRGEGGIHKQGGVPQNVLEYGVSLNITPV